MITRHNLRLILVEPEQPRNIGAAVRVAANFGVPSVTVVQLQELTDEELIDIRIASSGAVDHVDVLVVPTLPQALEGADSTLATSGRRRESDIPLVASVAEYLAIDETPAGTTLAVVFGRESTGLTAKEIDLCHALLRLPVTEEFPSMNLSHAITLVVYQALFGPRIGETPPPPSDNETLAPSDLQERWLAELAEKVEHKEAQMRRLIHRAKPTPEDMAMLFNLLKSCLRPE